MKVKLWLLLVIIFTYSTIASGAVNTSEVRVKVGDVFVYTVDKLEVDGDFKEEYSFGADSGFDFTQFEEGAMIEMEVSDVTLGNNNEIEVTVTVPDGTSEVAPVPMELVGVSPIVFTDWTFWEDNHPFAIEFFEDAVTAVTTNGADTFTIEVAIDASGLGTTIKANISTSYDKATGAMESFMVQSYFKTINQEGSLDQLITLTTSTLVERSDADTISQPNTDTGAVDDSAFLPGFGLLSFFAAVSVITIVKRKK